jgi:hypothetical protein
MIMNEIVENYKQLLITAAINESYQGFTWCFLEKNRILFGYCLIFLLV